MTQRIAQCFKCGGNRESGGTFDSDFIKIKGKPMAICKKYKAQENREILIKQGHEHILKDLKDKDEVACWIL